MTHTTKTIERLLPDAERRTSESRTAARQEAQEHELRGALFAAQSGVPRRFQNAGLTDFRPFTPATEKVFAFVRAYAEDFPAHYAAGRCIIMSGRSGTGKTRLACALCRHVALEHGTSCRYTTAYHIVRDIKDTYNRQGLNAGSERDILRGFISPDLLVVDEVGVQYGTNTEKLLLFEIINGRYEAVKPTVIISNENQDGMTAFLGSRAMDRLRENGGALLVFDWKSYRK